jgi:outer membrane protein TolC
MRYRLIGIVFLLNFSLVVRAQADLLPFDAYVTTIRGQHPLFKRAALNEALALAELRYARGAFDPKLYGTVDEKHFGDQTYFRYAEGGLSLPTSLLGLEVKAAYKQASGYYLNPEATLPEQGQAVLGLKLPLLRGLLTDPARTEVAQARVGLEAREAEAAALRNDLLLEAAERYWAWTYADRNLIVTREALDLAETGFRLVKASYEAGDKAPIDTLEAFLLVQTRELDLADAEIAYNNAAQNIQAFWWPREAAPLVNQAPIFGPVEPLDAASLRQAVAQHPSLRATRLKLEQLELERRLKQQYLLPKLDVEYQFLGSGFNLGAGGNDGAIRNYLMENYRYGISFSMPLPNRKGTSGVQLTAIKLAQTDLELLQKERDLLTKLEAYLLALDQLATQIDRYEAAVAGYRALVEAEQLKFSIGESSVFLLNSRQQKYLDAERKLLKLRAEQRKAQAGARWAAGVLGP